MSAPEGDEEAQGVPGKTTFSWHREDGKPMALEDFQHAIDHMLELIATEVAQHRKLVGIVELLSKENANLTVRCERLEDKRVLAAQLHHMVRRLDQGEAKVAVLEDAGVEDLREQLRDIVGRLGRIEG